MVIFLQFFLHFKFLAAFPCSQFISPFTWTISPYLCLEFVWDTFFALVVVQNKNWTLFSGWPDSPLFVLCPLFLLLPIWHYLANLFVVIPSLFNSVFACLFICLNVYGEQKCAVCFHCLVRRVFCCTYTDQTRQSSYASPTCSPSQFWYLHSVIHTSWKKRKKVQNPYTMFGHINRNTMQCVCLYQCRLLY